MLIIVVSGEEFYDEIKEEFISSEDIILTLEHSLASMSKWESVFRKPFLGPEEKSSQEIMGYIEAMVLSSNFSDTVYRRFTQDNMESINNYIGSEQSATTFVDMSVQKNRGRSEIITSELIYYWMVSYNIPFEFKIGI